MGGDSTLSKFTGLGLRAARVYARRAGEEAGDAMHNLLLAAVLGGLALAFGILGLGFAHGLAFALLQAAGVSLWQICAGFLAGDLVMALLAGLSARAMVTRPLLPETRRNLDELAIVLRG